MGVCYVHNAGSLSQLFKDDERTTEVASTLTDSSRKRRMVRGSGNRFKTELWLDASDRATSYQLPHKPANRDKTGRPMVLTFNQMDGFFSVRSNHVQLQAGEEVMLRVKQLQYVATEDFRAEPLETRKCRFPHENPGEPNFLCVQTFFRASCSS